MSVFNMKPVSELLKARGTEQGGKTQKYVDNAVLRYSDKYIPKRTGTLIRSGTIHTVIGSGEVKYCTPYARSVYYFNSGRGIQGTANGGLRGRLWFERMKAVHLRDILEGARKISGARRM